MSSFTLLGITDIDTKHQDLISVAINELLNCVYNLYLRDVASYTAAYHTRLCDCRDNKT